MTQTLPSETELLDATSRGRRALQVSVVYLGVLVLMVSGVVIRKSPGVPPAGGIGAIVGLMLIGVGFFIPVRWQVTYKGHAIRFENDPFRGERLFVDGRKVATGKRGSHTELTATIQANDGAGDRVIAVSDAGQLKFRCRIRVERANRTAT